MVPWKRIINTLLEAFATAFLTAGIFQLLQTYNISAWYIFIFLGVLFILMLKDMKGKREE